MSHIRQCLGLFVLMLPLCATAQQAQIGGIAAVKLEIPLNRAVRTNDIETWLAGRALPPKEKQSILEALQLLEKACTNCLITVPDEPPKLTSGSDKSGTNFAGFSIDGAALAASNDVVESAEACSTERPFYDAKKKRCYSFSEILAAVKNATQPK